MGPNLKYTYKSDEEGFFPVMNFRLDEYAHCLNPNRVNISPDKKGEYILMKTRREYCKDKENRTAEIGIIIVIIKTQTPLSHIYLFRFCWRRRFFQN